MSILVVKGMARDRPTLRSDSVIPGGIADSARSQSFQAKLADAGKQHQRIANRSANRRPGAKQSQQAPTSLTTTESRSDAARQATDRQSLKRRDVAQAGQYEARAAAARRRLRRFRKTTAKDFQKRLTRLMSDLGLTLVDVWRDASRTAVTLVVDQPGHSRIQFVIECNDASWLVTVRSDANEDTNALLAAGDSLQSRFDNASLGRVSLTK